MNLHDSVSTLKSVGAARLAALHKLRVFTLEDLLERLPRDYIDRTRLLPVCEIVTGQENVIRAKVLSAPEVLPKGNKTLTKVKIGDDTGFLEAVWFNQPYLKGRFLVGQEYIFTGLIQRDKLNSTRIQMQSPDFEAYDGENSGKSLSTLRIVPVYHATEGLTQKVLRGLIKQALDGVGGLIQEFLPPEILSGFNLCGRGYAIRNLHFPESDEAYFAARNRLVFEELFLLRYGLLRVKGIVKSRKGPSFGRLEFERGLLPFKLTNAQEKVLGEITADINSGFAMNRLIQGDVGSGKTAVAALACQLAAANGFQAALMAPTETLAVQHYKSFAGMFGAAGVRVGLLVGSLPAGVKKNVKHELANGEIDIIIGTHALIQDNVEFANLGLVITDEQHRFGVRQRGKLSAKAESPHVLIMTATPIPRTLALILYGDMDISVIDELPPGRKPIKTNAVNSTYRERVYNFIKKHADEGRQAYIICPLVSQSEKIDAASVEKYADELCGTVFRGYKTTTLHGKMKPTDKQAAMDAFAANTASILISTTVIEVGVNVPNATVILIENAERFGLAQLHQLRGRVGRGEFQSYCVMLTDSRSEVTKQRMEAMVGSNDGFVLSETDLKIRGPGEFFGTAQHGLPEMLLANLYTDINILHQAQEAAETYAAEKNPPKLLLEKVSKKLSFGGRVEL